LRSSIIGTTIGIIPATGASIAAFIGYAAAKRASDRPEEFGKGAYEGVAASEAANSSVAGADLIPTLTLGIPGATSAAILMGAFIAQGLRPGPMLFQEHAAVVYAIFTLLLLGNPIMLIQGWLLTGMFARLVTIRRSILFPGVLLFCVVGSYVYHNDVDDVRLALIAGLFAYGMRKLDYPMAPLVIAFILTPMAERSMKQALLLSHGNVSIFFTRPISVFFLVVAVLVIVTTVLRRRKALPEAL
jgi:putative tricarboxylic transport membrane protein